MLRMIPAVVIVSIALSAACGGDGGGEEYPASVIQNFMDACTAEEGASQENCACVLDKIQEELTLEEFIELEVQMANTGQIPEEFAGMVAECLR